jgi:hypothetical protein
LIDLANHPCRSKPKIQTSKNKIFLRAKHQSLFKLRAKRPLLLQFNSLRAKHLRLRLSNLRVKQKLQHLLNNLRAKHLRLRLSKLRVKQKLQHLLNNLRAKRQLLLLLNQLQQKVLSPSELLLEWSLNVARLVMLLID